MGARFAFEKGTHCVILSFLGRAVNFFQVLLSTPLPLTTVTKRFDSFQTTTDKSNRDHARLIL